MIGQRVGQCWLNLFGGPREFEKNSYAYMNKAKARAPCERSTLNELFSRTVYCSVIERRGRGAFTLTQAEGVGYRGRVLLDLRTEIEQEQQLVDGKLVTPPTTPVLLDAHLNDVFRANVRAIRTLSTSGCRLLYHNYMITVQYSSVVHAEVYEEAALSAVRGVYGGHNGARRGRPAGVVRALDGQLRQPARRNDFLVRERHAARVHACPARLHSGRE